MEGLDQFIKDVKKGKMDFSTMSNGLMRSAINEWRQKDRFEVECCKIKGKTFAV